MTNNKYIINKPFNQLTENEKMILSIKGACEEIKKDNELKDFYGAFIAVTLEKLKVNGIEKEEIFKYKFI